MGDGQKAAIFGAVASMADAAVAGPPGAAPEVDFAVLARIRDESADAESLELSGTALQIVPVDVFRFAHLRVGSRSRQRIPRH